MAAAEGYKSSIVSLLSPLAHPFWRDGGSTTALLPSFFFSWGEVWPLLSCDFCETLPILAIMDTLEQIIVYNKEKLLVSI